MDENLLNEFKEWHAWTTHVREVRDLYMSEMEKFPVESPEYKEAQQKFIKFMEESNLSSDERLWKLANMTGLDRLEIRKEAEIDVQNIVDQINRDRREGLD